MLNPLSINILVALPVSLVVFYLLGSLFTPKIKGAVLSVMTKLGMGSLVFVTVNAVVHAGFGTMLIVFLPIMPVFFLKRDKDWFEDVRSLEKQHVLVLLLVLVSAFLAEALRSDIREAEGIYVGNSDVSYYSSFGHFLYQYGEEAVPMAIYPGSAGIFYHFGDMWYSGFFSTYVDVLPYYAYNVLYRGTMVFLYFGLLFGLVLKLTDKTWLAVLSAVFALTTVNVNFYLIDSESISLLKTFMTSTPVYGSGPYLMPGMVFFLFMVFIFQGHFWLGSLGIAMVSIVNPALATSIPMAVAFMILVKVAFGMIKWEDPIPLSYLQLGLLFLAACLVYIYSKIDGRMEQLPDHLKTLGYLYLVVHTLIRYLISTIYVVPFFVGLWFYLRNTETKFVFWWCLALYLGVMASFAIIFPWLQSNSIQIMMLHFAGMFGPVAGLGLIFWLHDKDASSGLKSLAAFMLVLAVASSAYMAYISEGYKRLYDWSELEGHYDGSSMSYSEYENIKAYVDEHGDRLGFYMVNDSVIPGGNTWYHVFTGWQGTMPGLSMYRLNPIVDDTVASTYMRLRYLKTSLAHYSKGHEGGIVNRKMLEFVDPPGIFVPENDTLYGIPEELKAEFPHRISFGKYGIHSKEPFKLIDEEE